MPEWLQWVLEALKVIASTFVGGGLGGYGIFKYLERRHKIKVVADADERRAKSESDAAESAASRQARTDEIQVLYGIIERLERSETSLRSDFDEYRKSKDEDMSKLRSEHTACRLALSQMKQTRNFMREQVAKQNERIQALEAEIELLKGGS